MLALLIAAAELVIGGASLVAGMAGGPLAASTTHQSLWAMAKGPVFLASKKAAMTLGIAGGVMTGPA